MALSTATTSLSSSPTATATAPILAFTTPFPQPVSCSSPPLTTSVESYSDFKGNPTSRIFLLPDTSDARYTACLAPAGGQFTFSPAVCPQGWPAWWLGQTPTVISGAATTAHVSTAYCCAPGYSMTNQGSQDDPSPSCEQAFLTTTSSSGSSFVSTTTLSVASLPAWHISWQPSDIPTLSPQPPAIDGDRIIKWVPGSEPQRVPQDGWGRGMSRGLFFFLVVGIPLIIVAAIVACFVGCRVSRRRRGNMAGEAGTPKRFRLN